MEKLTLLLLVAMVPFLTMAQKKSKKRSKNDKISNSTNIASAYEFMVIKGAEIDMSNEEIFGKTFHTLSFGQAIEDGLLSDYQVIINVIDKQEIRDLIEAFKKVKVLVIGETIIDQYVFCEALGKSGKEPVLALRDLNTEEYLGGAAALSRHISPFCNKISLLSMVGEKSDYLNKIKKKLPKNVNFKYIKKNNLNLSKFTRINPNMDVHKQIQ